MSATGSRGRSTSRGRQTSGASPRNNMISNPADAELSSVNGLDEDEHIEVEEHLIMESIYPEIPDSDESNESSNPSPSSKSNPYEGLNDCLSEMRDKVVNEPVIKHYSRYKKNEHFSQSHDISQLTRPPLLQDMHRPTAPNMGMGSSLGTGSWCEKLCQFVGVVVAIVGVILGILWKQGTFDSILSPQTPAMFHKDLPHSFPIFKKEILQLENGIFSSQQHHSWTVLRAGVKPVLTSPSPLAPAVLLIAGNEPTTPYCLARAIAAAASKALGFENQAFIEVQSSKYAGESGEEVKLLVDSQLRHLKSIPVAVVHYFHILPENSPMIMFGYCDDQNAVFKDSIIILTIELNELAKKTLQKDLSNCDEVVNEYLTNIWKQNNRINRDKIEPFLARIANNIVCTVQEDKLDKNKC